MINSPTIPDNPFSDLGGGYVDHQPLSEVSPLRIGGVSRHFFYANTTGELINVVQLAINNKIPYRVIGAGTATLFGGSGYPGIIIKNQTNNVFRLDDSSRVICDSGVDNAQLINKMASIGLGGMEFISVIPGTVGAALVTDAHALGKKFKSYIKDVTLFNADTRRVENVKLAELDGEYLNNLFGDSLVFPSVILTMTLQFATLTQEEIIRRLTLIKNYIPNSTERCIGNVLEENIASAHFDKEFTKHLKSLMVIYDAKSDRLTVKKEATPNQVKRAVILIREKAKEFGINGFGRLSCLGYFDNQEIEAQPSSGQYQL